MQKQTQLIRVPQVRLVVALGGPRRLERARGDVLRFDLGAWYMEMHLVEIHQAGLLGSAHSGRYAIPHPEKKFT